VKLKPLLLSLLLTLSVWAESPSYEEIKVMPSSYAKDYYSWRFIQKKSTSKKEAKTAYLWTKRKGAKLRKAIRRKVGYIPKVPQTKPRKKRDPKNFIISPSSASKKRLKSQRAIRRLYNKVKKQGRYSDVLQVMASKDPFKELETLSFKTQAYIFNGVTSTYRKRYFNHAFSEKQIEGLVKEKPFNKTIFKAVTTHSLHRVKKSLLFYSGTNSLKFQSNFLLAMNAIELKEPNYAINFLSIARTRTVRQSQYDQVDFWLYLLTKHESFLKRLARSHQVNIYTLKARDILKMDYPKVVTPILENREIKDFNMTNPIDWEKLKNKMKSHPEEINRLAEHYKSSQTLPIYSYLKEKASKYTVPYYPMPYLDAMKDFEVHRKALILAIARQESRFVPASVSPSYALGMMQIMPFLIKHLAKERREKLDLNDMFNPYTAISYADQHLDYLNKWLYHPLFVAYAYNGGIGFTKRHVLKTKHLFKEGEFEPYLSMELIDYVESREYGKKVLTNYIIYLNLFGEKATLSPLFDKLKYPSQTDRFRK